MRKLSISLAMESCWFSVLLFLLSALIPCSTKAAGVTVITHGYNGDVTGWITAMADEIPTFSIPAIRG